MTEPARPTSATGLRATLLSPLAGVIYTAVVYVFGLVWRYFHIFKLHRPTDYVYSDMNMYVELGKRFAKEGYKLQPHDVTHPPGLSELLAYYYKQDPSLSGLIRLQFWITALVPLAIGLLGWLAFDRKTGLWAIAIASVYFPFIDYGGYFLAEIYLTFFATLTMVGYLGAVRIASAEAEGQQILGVAVKRLALAVFVAALAGFTFSLAMVMKMVAVPALFCFFGLYVFLTKTSTWKVKFLLVVVLGLAALPLTKWQATRCTEGNGGKFCPGSNKAPADFLMGHTGRVQMVNWIERDPKRPEKIRSNVGFGSPAAYQHGYTKKVEYNFKIHDGPANNDAAWKWIKENPGQAVVLSFEHVFDSFGGTLPWPTVATKHWPVSQTFHYLFLVFLMLPTFMFLVNQVKQRGIVAFLRSTELAIFGPILGIVISVMIATGEARYRIPWDMCFIVLAVQFYRSLKKPAAPEVVAAAPAVSEPEAEPAEEEAEEAPAASSA